MRKYCRPALCASVVLMGALVVQIEPKIVNGLVFESADSRMTIGAVRVPLWSAAWAQSSESLTLENVVFTSGTTTYEAKQITFSGLTSTRTELDAILSNASPEPLALRLARLNVKEVSLPDVKVTQRVGAGTQTVIYKNVVLKDVVQGRIAEAIVETAGAELTDGTDRTTFSYGHTSINALDLPALARLYELPAQPGANPPVRIYGEFTIANFVLLNEKDGAQLTIARISGRDFMARTTSETWAGASTLFAELATKDDLSDEEQNRLVATLADFLGAFDFGQLEATGLDIKGTTNSGAATATIARVAYRGATASQPSAFLLDDFKIRDANANFAIANITLTGFSLHPTLEGLKNLQGKSLDALDAETARRLVPTLGTLKVTGIDIDSSVQGVGGKASRVTSTVKELEFGAASPLNGIPTELRMAVQNFAITLPETSNDDGIKDLLALGYRSLDLSFLFAAEWNAADSEVAIRSFSLQGTDMANISATGMLGNVSKDVFDTDQAVAAVALLGARVKALDVQLEDRGLYNRFLDKTAREEKTTPDALRRTYGLGAAVLVPSVLGQSPQATKVSQAISRFVAKPGRLSISAKSKDPGGIGLLEIFTLSDPKAVMEKLDISATAD
jgi:hypothetical protein